jgi:O-antigen ligase
MILAAFLISENLNKFNPTTIFKILTAVSVAVCLFGLYQFVGDTLGLPIALTGLKAMYTKAVFGFPRIQSTGLEPLYFANFLIIPIMLTANLILNGLVKSKWYLASIFLYALTLCLTLSRGGIIASLFGLAIILVSVLFYRHNHKTVLYLIGALVLSGVVAVGMVDMSGYINHLSNPKTSNNTVQQYIKQSSTLSPTATSADSDRLANKSLALDMFKSHPITGVGVGNFGNYAHLNYDQYKTDNGSMIVNNEYYEILAETGVLGALSIIGLFLSLFYLSVKKLLTTKDVEVRAWILALLCILLSFAVQYYAFSTLYIMHIWVVVGLMMGFSLQNRSLNHSKKLGV